MPVRLLGALALATLLVAVPAVARDGSTEARIQAVEASADGSFTIAQTTAPAAAPAAAPPNGQTNGQNRRANRQGCREQNGLVGADKRNCKQEGRQN